jgi:hypothetical protein
MPNVTDSDFDTGIFTGVHVYATYRATQLLALCKVDAAFGVQVHYVPLEKCKRLVAP